MSLDMDLSLMSFLTMDATAMYTNINTDHALRIIGNYLQQNSLKFPSVPFEAVMVALTLVMKCNVFRFGDTYWNQIEMKRFT